MSRGRDALTSGSEGWRRRMADVAELVVWAALMKAPTLGRGRLVCVDGPTGSGKSTLGEALHDAASEVGTAALVHLDDLLDGWSGLPTVAETMDRDVLSSLRHGRAGRYRRYDWHLERFAEEHVVDPVDILIVEGAGSGATAYASDVTVLVWVDAPADVRLARGISRDGEGLRAHLVRWMADEEAHFARERTRDRADVIVDGSGESDQTVVLA